MVSEKSKETLEKLSRGRYVNDREIKLGGVPYKAREVLISAPLITRLNTYFVGGTGRGKTQLGNDLISYFYDSSCYAMGRPDFEPSELLKQINLAKLKPGAELTDRELVELTENVRKNLFFIDELNRAPPIVQNYFFDFFDGKIVHNGKIANLGKEGFSIGFATGNLGDGEYIGVSDSDRALKDRMHMIMKVDHPDYKPTPLNMLDVFRGKKNPRTDMPTDGGILTKDIIELGNEFMERKTNPLFPFLGIYLSEGLDYLEQVKGHSKIACDKMWPNINGIRQDSDESKIFVLSPRSVFSTISLTGALEMIAEARGVIPKQPQLFLDSLRFTVPYSGILAPSYVDVTHGGNVYSAFDNVLGSSSENYIDIVNRSLKLEEAIALSEIGIKGNKLPDLIRDIFPGAVPGKWSPVVQAITDNTGRNAKKPEENQDDFIPRMRDIVEKAYEKRDRKMEEEVEKKGKR